MDRRPAVVPLNYCKDTFVDILTVQLRDALQRYQISDLFDTFYSQIMSPMKKGLPDVIPLRFAYMFYWDRLMDIYFRNLRPDKLEGDIKITSYLLVEYMLQLIYASPHAFERYVKAFTKPSAKQHNRRRMYDNTPEVMDFINSITK